MSDDEDIPIIKPEAAGVTGPKPSVHFLSDWKGEIRYMVDCLQAWHKQGIAWRDMAVIYIHGYQGKAIANQLKELDIPHLWMATKDYKKNYDPSIDRITVLTIQSSKGLEFPSVIITGVGQLGNKEAEQDARLLYVGMTRAQRELQLTMSNKTKVSERVLALAG